MPSEKYRKDHDEDSLKSTHELYSTYYNEWEFLNAAYEGIRALIAWGALTQHERESYANFERRQDEAYGFSYSKSICDLFNSFLFKKEMPRTIPPQLSDHPLWIAFQDDCDMYDTDFDDFFIEQSLFASILGHIGILVDMPSEMRKNREEEISYGVYPYFAAYKPTHILDWEWERDGTGRPRLIYLKLLDDDEMYRIWTPELWEVWQIQEGEGVDEVKVSQPYQAKDQIQAMGKGAVKLREGVNGLGEIPFVWVFNQRSTINKEIGMSDIADIARIDTSILRNLSQIEQIIDYAAFPMMRKPMQESKGGLGADSDDEVGVTAVLEFDPEHPESKPDWLPASVGEPVQATLGLIEKKIDEIYRSANVGGMAAMEVQAEAKSGVALKAEFQMLNSKLVKKSKAIAQAKRNCVDFWLKWLGAYDALKDEIVFDHVETFEIEDLMTDLENILTAGAIVTYSPTFAAETQKLAAKKILASADDETITVIEEEIDAGAEQEAELRAQYFEQQQNQGMTPPAIEDQSNVQEGEVVNDQNQNTEKQQNQQ